MSEIITDISNHRDKKQRQKALDETVARFNERGQDFKENPAEEEEKGFCLSIGVDDDLVTLDFGMRVSSLVFEPEEALKIGQALIRASKEVDNS